MLCDTLAQSTQEEYNVAECRMMCNLETSVEVLFFDAILWLKTPQPNVINNKYLFFVQDSVSLLKADESTCES